MDDVLMGFAQIKIRVSLEEVNSTKGTLRDMLIDRGYRPIIAQLPGANRQLTERKIYALDEPVVDEAEDLRARVAAKAENIARETRAIFQQRLEKALGNGIFDAATNRTRMETQYKSALQERINWEQLESEALLELQSGQPMQTSAGTTSASAFAAKLDHVLASSSAARAREAHDWQHTLLQERINRSLGALKRSGNSSSSGNVLGGLSGSTPMERRTSRSGSVFKAVGDPSTWAGDAPEAPRRLGARPALGLPRATL